MGRHGEWRELRPGRSRDPFRYTKNPLQHTQRAPSNAVSTNGSPQALMGLVPKTVPVSGFDRSGFRV